MRDACAAAEASPRNGAGSRALRPGPARWYNRARARSSVTTLFRRIPSRCAAAGCSTAMSCLRRPGSPATRSISLRDLRDYPVMSVMQFEDLGFCAKGEGPEFVRSHDSRNEAAFRGNTSGGQLPVGQAGAAAGFLASPMHAPGHRRSTRKRGTRCGLALVSGFA